MKPFASPQLFDLCFVRRKVEGVSIPSIFSSILSKKSRLRACTSSAAPGAPSAVRENAKTSRQLRPHTRRPCNLRMRMKPEAKPPQKTLRSFFSLISLPSLFSLSLLSFPLSSLFLLASLSLLAISSLSLSLSSLRQPAHHRRRRHRSPSAPGTPVPSSCVRGFQPRPLQQLLICLFGKRVR